MITASQVKERDGWTDAAIRRFLGERDGAAVNPHCGTGPMLRLYARDRVLAVEATAEFGAWKAKSLARSARAREALERGRTKLLAEVTGWEPNMRVPEGDLVENARAAYEAHHADRDDGPRFADSDDRHFLRRIVGNYVRHECSDYRLMVARIRKRFGAGDLYDDARRIIDERIDDRIDQLLTVNDVHES